MPAAPNNPVLVIGYGNELRGDDAAGPRVVLGLGRAGLPGVRTLVVQQLTPELSEMVSQARAAVFVDASRSPATGKVAARRLDPSPGVDRAAHSSNPRALLALALALFGRCPPAWLVTIPGRCFDYGTRLSPAAERGVAEAVARVRQLIRVRFGVSQRPLRCREKARKKPSGPA
jgi:hydrogenase maturation protease